ncbi:uncharacterized protein LOC104582950 [Brachypodium distachyon]|uniref:Uncharacterized protein n=1 Tax=Brachypodium distachyon TaxID=15368 RepID=I1HV40_BRADI|nr:uncharacterized protein LOC104582950 [Brachypodium distachyon]KQK11480.1 hypothetical protein BRADI_2g60470v3 [Brachypodium distachyon]KQK11481.1 hypothetical protein BRADI_2g60470v3 [Brachypodium distachyon]|eukprot:XP_010232799.1 uncharacterized protein LOC104582950 [Brachypodium distachyon]
MADMVGSAIVGEAVGRIFSRITNSKGQDKTDEATGVGLERLEMARIKMEAALETSNRWQITDTSLLHWRKKLKRAAQDCEDATRRCRQHSQEEDERKQMAMQSSFPRRIAHTTKAIISSFLSRNNDHCSYNISDVRRFERFADGATEFMRFVQLGGTPRHPLFFDPLVGHIFAGKFIRYMVLHPRGGYHCFAIQPVVSEERGLEVTLYFLYEDCKVFENSFTLGLMMRISESTDIIGTTVKCLGLVTPHFKSTADIVIKEITQLPTQDFFCSPPEVTSADAKNHWTEMHTTFSTWFRPDPLCCQGYEHDSVSSCGGGESSSGNKLRLSSIFPEPVCQVSLQRSISQSEYSNQLQGSTTRYDSSYLENYPPLQLGITFMPHDSLKEPKSGEGSTIEAIDGEKQHLTHAVHPDQLDGMLIPKAIDYLYHSAEATTYEICWRSNHGSALLFVYKTSTLSKFGARTASTRQGRRKSIKMLREILRGQMKNVQWKEVAKYYLKLWVVRSSVRLQSMFTEWLKR